MNRQKQTIELLQLLGSDVAESVLAQLDPEQAEKIRTRVFTPPKQVFVRPRQQRQILDSFEEFFGFAMKNGIGLPPEPPPSIDPEPPVPEPPAAESSPTHEPTPPEPESKPEPESLPEEPPVEPAPMLKLSVDPLTDLQLITLHQLTGALETEQPKTTAILLSNLGPKLAADALSLFNPDYQKAVVKEISREQHAPQVLVERIARATLNRGLMLSPDPPDRRSHVDRLAELLRSVPRNYRMNMLGSIEEQDEELSKALRKKMYRFEDIASLEPKVIQRILGEVDAATLTAALFNIAVDIKEAVLGNLSRRARQTIDEEMQYQTTVAEAKVTQAREQIADIIARIDQEAE